MKRTPRLTVEQLHQGFALGDIFVKPDEGSIIRDSHVYKLAPKAMQVLVCLASSHCQVQSRQQIVDFAWREQKISSNSITHIISEIRQALGDHKECPRFIQTVPRKGYRMMMEATKDLVEQPKTPLTSFADEPLPPATEAQQGRLLFPTIKKYGTGLILLVAIALIIFNVQSNNPPASTQPQKPSFASIDIVSNASVKQVTDNAIAILLFNQTSADDVPQYIAPSIQQELVEQFTHSPDFQVASIRATNDLGDSPSVALIRERLSVKYLLEGHIRYVDENIKISVNLINTTTGFQVWSEKVEGHIDELLTVYKALSRKLVNSLSLLVLGENAAPSEGKSLPTNNFAAFDNYLQGKSALRDSDDVPSLKRSEAFFQEAITQDPNFILARSALCHTYMELYHTSNDTQYYEKGINLCELTSNVAQPPPESKLALGKLYLVSGRYAKAKQLLLELLIDIPEDSEVLITLAQVFAELKDTSSAREYFLKAITIEPAYWRHYYDYGLFLFYSGEFEQAISQFNKSIHLNDQNVEAYNALGGVYYLSTNFEQAHIAWSKALAIKPSSTALSNIGTSLFFMHKFEEAIIVYKQALDVNELDNVTWANLADAYKYANDAKQAHESYLEALKLAKKQEQVNPNNIHLQAQIGRYYSELDQCESANSYKDMLVNKTITDPYVFYDLSLVAINCKQLLQAEGFIKKSIELGYDKSFLLPDPQFAQFKDLFH